MQATVIGRQDNLFILGFRSPILADLDNYGQMPIPPYFERKADETDDERYQTVFHNPTKSASVAAPTASLHFDDALLTQLRKKRRSNCFCYSACWFWYIYASQSRQSSRSCHAC